MNETYTGFDGKTYRASFAKANNNLGGKVKIGVLRVTCNGVAVSEEITTARQADEFFAEINARRASR